MVVLVRNVPPDGSMGLMTFEPSLTLSGGTAIPAIGVGTWPLDDAGVERMLHSAFEVGYRLVDTAENYGNEAGVGAAVRGSGIARDDIFVTTKFNRQWHGDAVSGVEGNLSRLGLDRVDLVLIHWPNPDQDLYVKAWEGLIEAREKGLTRAIGTSNFTPAHLERIIAATGVTPDVNQIQCNPFHDRAAERAFHTEHGIVTESWSPLGAGKGLVEHPEVLSIAQAHGVTAGQVVLAWHLQQGLVPIPKSASAERLAENFGALQVTLAEGEIARLSDLQNPDYRLADSDAFGH